MKLWCKKGASTSFYLASGRLETFSKNIIFNQASGIGNFTTPVHCVIVDTLEPYVYVKFLWAVRPTREIPNIVDLKIYILYN